ncbi:MAG: hypothetical protein Fur005_38290 [Roseiflexaceae bacterium]
MHEAHQQANWALGAELFRPLQHSQLAQAWGGVQAHVFDDRPLIGSIAVYPGLSMALGSWHGFGLAPAIGQALAQHLA